MCRRQQAVDQDPGSIVAWLFGLVPFPVFVFCFLHKIKIKFCFSAFCFENSISFLKINDSSQTDTSAYSPMINFHHIIMFNKQYISTRMIYKYKLKIKKRRKQKQPQIV